MSGKQHRAARKARRALEHAHGERDLSGHLAENPKEVGKELRLAAAHGRGLPASLAEKFYRVVEDRVEQKELSPAVLAKLGNATAAFAKADIETGRYEKGEPGSTVNINQQVAIESVSEQQRQIFASVLPPSIVYGQDGKEMLPMGNKTNGNG